MELIVTKIMNRTNKLYSNIAIETVDQTKYSEIISQNFAQFQNFPGPPKNLKVPENMKPPEI